jgi:hypothetical protein
MSWPVIRGAARFRIFVVRWPLACALLAALSSQLWTAPTAAASPCERRTAGCGPLRVPGEFRTIQGAIDAAPDGATILIAAGVYNEPFRVEGKRLRIIGSDDGRTEIVSASAEVQLATYANGGGGELKSLFFRGGACAVCGIRDGPSMPSALSLKNVTAADGYRGVFGGFSSLDLKSVEVFGTRWHGISITHVGVKLTFGDIEVHDVGGVGLLVLNGGPGDMVIGGHFHDNAKGGIEILGHNGTVNLLFVVADYNAEFGVALFDASVGIALSLLGHNGSPTPTGCQGGGLLARDSSSVTVTGTIFATNCIGIFNSESSVAFGSDTFDSNAAELGHNSEAPFSWNDLGNNVCGQNIGTANETLYACQDKSLDIQPPDPLEP